MFLISLLVSFLLLKRRNSFVSLRIYSWTFIIQKGEWGLNNRTILGNATMAHVNMNVNIDVKQVVKDIFIEINEAKDDIIKANMIDIRNSNAFEIDFNIIGMMEEELLKIDVLYNKSIYLENNLGEYLLNDSFGTICAMYNGNTYYLIELALKSILTRNSMIFVSETNYMDFTNRLILILIKNILNKYGIDKNLIQLLYSDDFHVLLSNNASINRVFAIGDLEFQNIVKESSSVEVICLGIDRYDIYIEDIKNISILEELSKIDCCDIYVKSGLKVSFDDYIEVKDVEEAVGQINFNTAGHDSIILTDSKSSASYFAKNVKADNVFVNTLFTKNYLKFDIDLFLRKKKVICHSDMMNDLFGGSYE